MTIWNRTNFSDVSLPYMDFLENIRLLIGGASICILFLTVSRSIISREQFWRFLDALGMRRGQMYQIIFWEAVLFGAGAVIVGNLAGIGIYQLVIPAFEKKITEQTLPQAIAWEGVLLELASVSYVLLQVMDSVQYSFAYF